MQVENSYQDQFVGILRALRLINSFQVTQTESFLEEALEYSKKANLTGIYEHILKVIQDRNLKLNPDRGKRRTTIKKG